MFVLRVDSPSPLFQRFLFLGGPRGFLQEKLQKVDSIN
jgi:hypothetical protein